jgi:hypothetical protein
METLLDTKIIIELNKASKKLLIGDTVKLKASATWLKKTIAWCDEQHIILGNRCGSDFYIQKSGVESIENWLKQNNQGSLAQLAKCQTGNRQQVAVYSSNEKIAKISPSEFMVLSACTDVRLCKDSQLIYGLTEIPPQINIEIDIRYLDLSLFNYLIVIENLDSFNDWHQYILNKKLSNALIVYRGDKKGHSKACQALKKRWLDEKGYYGQIFFGDFDVAGLAIAIDSKVAYQQVLLPELSYIKKHLDTLQYKDNYAYSRRNLFNECPEKWQFLLKILLENKASLRQQNMFNTPLILY